ncbi:MAG: preprotein translocase subunit YajC [Clostridiales bacterium]|nr:preprotein translocase subunit YajC [Clostridiales bacterium]MBQ3321302.1 preprotein translocase subunit YajC [Bacillota bacterium]
MGSSMFSILILVLLFAVMYFLMIRPQKKREKETKAMRASLAVGDEIVTIGGLCCKVVKTKDESIVVQVGPDKVKMEFMRWAVSKVVKQGSGHVEKASVDDFDEVADAEKKEARKSKPKRMKKAAVVEEVEEAPEVVEEVKEAEEAVVEEAAAAAEEVAEVAEEAAADAE